MSTKETKKNNIKTKYNNSSKNTHSIPAGSDSIAIAEQPKSAKSTGSGQIDALRPSEKPGKFYKPIEIPRERIEERAKAIWEQRGRPQGDDQSNWYEAENQLRREFVSQE